MAVKTTEKDVHEERLDLDDRVLVHALVNGKLRLLQRAIGDFYPGGRTLNLNATGSPYLIDERNWLGKFININNTEGPVVIELPAHNSFNYFGIIAVGRIQSGDHPVSVRCTVLDQLRCGRHSAGALGSDEIFIGTSTPNADENIFFIVRHGGLWNLICPYGARAAADDDVSLGSGGGGGVGGSVAILNEGEAVTSAASIINFVGTAVNASSGGAGVVNVSVSATEFGETALSFTNPLDWNLSVAPRATITLTGSTTINATNITNGGDYTLAVTQDETGGRTVTFGAGFADSPSVDTDPNVTTILRFYASGGLLYSADNIGEGETIGQLNAIGPIDPANDRLLIERASDNSPLNVSPIQLLGTIVPFLDEPTNDTREIGDSDHNRVIRMTGSTPAVSVPAGLASGLACGVLNKTGAAVSIAGDGITLVGDSSVSDDHFAVILWDGTEATVRASG